MFVPGCVWVWGWSVNKRYSSSERCCLSMTTEGGGSYWPFCEGRQRHSAHPSLFVLSPIYCAQSKGQNLESLHSWRLLVQTRFCSVFHTVQFLYFLSWLRQDIGGQFYIILSRLSLLDGGTIARGGPEIGNYWLPIPPWIHASDFLYPKKKKGLAVISGEF